MSSKNNVGTLGGSKSLVPFLKWAGGKRWLSSRLESLGIPRTGRYIEPFLGSAAVFFSLNPRKSILADTNKELVETYRALKEDWRAVLRVLRKHHARHCESYYYSIRKEISERLPEVAARFIYLNRTCWNGLYRVNLRGEFNVPIGTKMAVLLSTDNFEEVSRRLRYATILHSDFETIIEMAEPGDVIFADPPYTVRHNYNGFVKYNERLFSWSDQVRLRDALIRAKRRGARVVATNADHRSVRDLYVREFSVSRVSRFSAISSSAASRGSYSELILVDREHLPDETHGRYRARDETR